VKSRIYEGRIRHRRFHPKGHEFSYTMFLMYLDLEEIPGLFGRHPLWSATRAAPARFLREDYLGDPKMPLADAVRGLVEERTGVRSVGPIRLLTHLRYFGKSFNPVSFYYCFSEDDTRLETIVAEVTNTPWGERHAYVLDRRHDVGNGRTLRFRPGKEFHVSPFMPMEQSYDWRFTVPGRTIAVQMENFEDGRKLFDATLTFTEGPVTGAALTRAIVRFPFLTLRIIAAIYWQALRLWWKKIPFHPHPGQRLKEVESC
jgi:uncharacterized protein